MSDYAFAAGGSGCVAVHSFGPGSYYGVSGFYRLERSKSGPIRRVGVDTESPDHISMVTREFPCRPRSWMPRSG